MVKYFAVAIMALVPFTGSGHTQTSSKTASQKAGELSQEIVAMDGDRERLSKSLNPVEVVITGQIEKTLNVTEFRQKDRIGGIVHNGLQTLEGDIIEAKVSGMAQTYTVEELEGNLAFGRSPAGRALRGAAPELNRELKSAVLGQSELEVNGPPISEQKATLIGRILKARNVETDARRGWRVLSAIMAKALSDIAKSPNSPAAPVNDQAGEDAYVARVVAVEMQFYSTNFSQEQLSEIATYLEGPNWRALVLRAPALTSITASATLKIFERRFLHIESEACELVGCDVSQRAALDAWFGQARSMMASGVNVLAH